MIQLIVLLVVLIPILAIVLDSQLGRALAGRIEGRRIQGGDEVTQERIALLEGEVERLSKELNRVSEESQFLHKLLTARSSGDDGQTGPESGDRHPG